MLKKFKPYQAQLTAKEKEMVDGEEIYDKSDRDKMTDVMKKVKKPCLGFKILAAGRSCKTSDEVKESFQYAYKNIKKEDAIVVGMFQKYKNQIKENTKIVNDIFQSVKN